MNSSEPELYRLKLKLPRLIVRGARGLLAGNYPDVETFNQTGEAAAIVTGVKGFEDMMTAKTVAVSCAGIRLGLGINMTGAEVMKKICEAGAAKNPGHSQLA